MGETTIRQDMNAITGLFKRFSTSKSENFHNLYFKISLRNRFPTYKFYKIRIKLKYY